MKKGIKMKLSYPLLFTCITLLVAAFLSSNAQISLLSALPISLLPGLLIACIVKMLFTKDQIFAKSSLGKLLSKLSVSKGSDTTDQWLKDDDWTTNPSHPWYLLQEQHEEELFEEMRKNISYSQHLDH